MASNCIANILSLARIISNITIDVNASVLALFVEVDRELILNIAHIVAAIMADRVAIVALFSTRCDSVTASAIGTVVFASIAAVQVAVIAYFSIGENAIAASGRSAI